MVLNLSKHFNYETFCDEKKLVVNAIATPIDASYF